MDRAQKLKLIQQSYADNAVDFDGMTDEQESKVMDALSTILEKTKP